MTCDSKFSGTDRNPAALDVVNVLVVDDDPLLREMLVMMLKIQGRNVLQAENGAQALAMAKALKRGAIDILITDLNMPGMSGIELAVELRTARPEIRTIFTSGHSAGEMAARSCDFPESICVQKPYHPDTMNYAIRALFVPAAMPC